MVRRTSPPPETFVEIADAAALVAWLTRPGVALIFLHVPGCAISVRAYWDLARFGEPVALLDVRAHPALAGAVEERTGIRHESPQAILLRDGEAAWSASHWGVTAAAVTEAIASAPAPPEKPVPATDQPD